MNKHIILTAILLLIIIVVFAAMPSLANGATTETPSTEYALTTVVINVDEENDIVQCVDFNGNIWEFKGCNDWVINDYCAMIMNDNGTEEIEDDIIVSTHYSGWLDGVFGYDEDGKTTARNILTTSQNAPQTIIETETLTDTITEYITVTEQIDATEEQLEDAFADGYNDGSNDGYGEGYWQGYHDRMNEENG